MRLYSVVTLVLAVAFASSPSRASGGYTLVDLGQQTLPEAINSHGVAVGIDVGGIFTYDAVGGNRVEIATPAGASYDPHAINAGGVIAGEFTTNSGGPSAFYYANGQFHTLLSTATESAYGINNAGHIVGASAALGFPSTGAWISTDGSTLHPIGGNGYTAYAINNLDQVTGVGVSGLFYYANGKEADITTPTGGNAVGRSISDSGNIAGAFLDHQQAFLYSHGQFINIPAINGKSMAPASVNNLGTVVGEASTNVFDQVAFVYQDGVTTDLNTFVDPASGWQLFQATGVNDAGYIAGYGSVNGLEHGFVLIPTPEPGAVVLGVAALVLLQRHRNRNEA